VTLDSLVYAYGEGHSPETITPAFWLDHEQVYGAITFYLAHRQEVDEYIRKGEVEQDALREQLHRRSPALHQKLVEAKRTREATRGAWEAAGRELG
jgi:hypothetical protein